MTNCSDSRCYTDPMEVLYLDRLFLLNTLADYLLCLAAAKIAGACLHRWRCLAAAVLGGVYAVLIWLPGLDRLSSPFFKLAVGLLMALIAYGGEERPLRCAFSFFAVSAAFGGTLWALSGGGPVRLSLPVLALGFAGCYGLFTLIFRARGQALGKSRTEVLLAFLGREVRFPVLVDTGNCLADPISGAPVLIVNAHALRPLFRGNAALLELPPVELVETCAAVPELAGRVRLLPFSAVGGGGLLPVFRPERLLIDGREDRDRLVAISPAASGDGFVGIL